MQYQNIRDWKVKIMDQKEKRLNTWTLALCIAAMPPVWAVLAPHLGVTVGAVALICAGIFVANGNKYGDALKIFLGFAAGDIWAVLAITVMEKMPLNPEVELYVTLFVMGGLAVLIGEAFPKILYTPSWLAGWAIGLTIMAPLGTAGMGTLPFEIAAAMFAGVFYVGIGVDFVQQRLKKLFHSK